MVVILMGASGSGKTTIGKMLAERLGWKFLDADDFHSASNIEKMSRGIPLKDEDRFPWLEQLRNEIHKLLEGGTSGVVACSALKESYRKILSRKNEPIRFAYLKGNYDQLQKHLQSRHGHFMKSDLLESQLQTLQEPEDAIVADISSSPESIVKTILTRLQIHQ